jgi:hypothetical protein
MLQFTQNLDCLDAPLARNACFTLEEGGRWNSPHTLCGQLDDISGPRVTVEDPCVGSLVTVAWLFSYRFRSTPEYPTIFDVRETTHAQSGPNRAVVLRICLVTKAQRWQSCFTNRLSMGQP